ncbi:MAG: TonB family protein [Chryseosolibacter sp.]
MKDRKNDIERYLRGKLSSAEMHALEKEALNDPFLAEALEGVEQAGTDNFLYDLHRINRSVHKRARRRSRKHGTSIRMWGWTAGIAATVLLTALAGFLVINILKEQEARQQAMQEPFRILPDRAEADTIAIPLPREVSAAAPRKADRRAKTNDAARTEAAGTDVHERASQQDPPLPSEATAEAEQQEALIALNENDKDEEIRNGQDRVQEAPVSIAATETSDVNMKAGAAKKETRVARHEAERLPAAGSTPDPVVVKGKVTSADGASLPGVNVIIKGTNKGTVTDVDGNYELTVPALKSQLVFSFIGFESREIAVQDQGALNVQLNDDVASLSEVVVTGYSSEEEKSAPFTFAEPEGGRSDFRDYLNRAVKYPEEALRIKAEGRVIIRFTVEPSGETTGFEILKGVGHGCEQELIRAIQAGPSWKPSRKGAVAVRDTVKVRFNFQLPRPGK